MRRGRPRKVGLGRNRPQVLLPCMHQLLCIIDQFPLTDPSSDQLFAKLCCWWRGHTNLFTPFFYAQQVTPKCFLDPGYFC
jgi:hypothetical protein